MWQRAMKVALWGKPGACSPRFHCINKVRKNPFYFLTIWNFPRKYAKLAFTQLLYCEVEVFTWIIPAYDPHDQMQAVSLLQREESPVVFLCLVWIPRINYKNNVGNFLLSISIVCGRDLCQQKPQAVKVRYKRRKKHEACLLFMLHYRGFLLLDD